MQLLDYIENATLLLGALALIILNIATAGNRRVEAAKLRAEIAKINYEMQPNSGSSLRDTINVLATRSDSMEKSIGGFRRDMVAQLGDIRDDMRLDRASVASLHNEKHTDHSELRTRLTRLEHKE